MNSGPVVVPLPEPLGRRPRVGPFPSGPEALKFGAFAAVGAVVADAAGPLLWLPFLAAGFALAVVRIDGKSIDGRAAEYARWRLRPRGRRSDGRPRGSSPLPGRIAVRPNGVRVAVLSTGGVPVAFLPRRDAEGLYDGFRSLLRAESRGLYLLVGTEPVPSVAFLPRGTDPVPTPEGSARAGYGELVRHVARRRRTRRVEIVCWAGPEEPDGLPRLEERVEALFGGLSGLGLSVERLEGAPLSEAMTRLGWEEARA